MSETFEYPQIEMCVGQYAVNWKAYFSKSFQKYIKGDVVEVGAGIGANTKFMFTDQVTSWTYLEPDIRFQKSIKESLPVQEYSLHGTTEDLPLHTNYDTAIYIDVLEHIEDSEEEIKRITNKLKTGGKLIILVPAYQFLYTEFDKNIGHYRRYNKERLRKDTKGLRELELFYLDSVGVLASMVNKLFFNKGQLTKGTITFWDTYMIPLSRILDPIVGRRFGKSLIGIYEKV